MKYLLFIVWSLLFCSKLVAQQSSIVYHPFQGGFVFAEQEKDLLTGQNLRRGRLILEANTSVQYKFPVKSRIFLYGGLGYSLKYHTTRHEGTISDIAVHLGLDNNIPALEAELNIKNVGHTDHYLTFNSGVEFLLPSSKKKTKSYLFIAVNLDMLLGTRVDPGFSEPGSWLFSQRVGQSSIDSEIVSFVKDRKHRFLPSIEFGPKVQFGNLGLNWRFRAYLSTLSPAFEMRPIGLLGLAVWEFPINSKHKNE